MSVLANFTDRLSNLVSGKGTGADKSVYAGYHFTPSTPHQTEAAYRTSWLMRKIVDLPALDMTREWRSWQADRDVIETLEREERRLGLRDKCKRALILSRLWGGGAIVMGIPGQEPEDELRLDSIRKGGLAYLHVFARSQISIDEVESDPTSEWFGQPKSYMITPKNGTQITIHPSRVIAFVGQPCPEGSSLMSDTGFWGDPLYQSIEVALQNADLAQDGFAALIDEAKIDVIKIPDLMKNIGSAEYETKLKTRLSIAKRAKSLWRALILDGKEEWEQKEVNWSGIPDVISTYLQLIAGAADMPVTRLLGQSPKGLQSTGEGEEKDYHAMIMARQNEILAPCLDRLDEVLIRSALGSRPEEIWYRFNPLMQLSPKEASEIEKNRATTIKTYSDTGLIDPAALAAIAKNSITESGQWPGSEQAFEENDDDPEDAPENNPEAVRELMLPEEREAMDRKAPRRIIADRVMLDAKPKTLYVSRKIVNAADIIDHFKAQGIETTLPADDLHVTVAFSRQVVDWMQISADWSGGDDGRYTIPPGGPRQMDMLGKAKDALVLLFNDDHLHWRHQHMADKGASWDHDEYQPHITISWQAGDIDPESVDPWKGPIVLGPELFDTVDEDWKEKIEET